MKKVFRKSLAVLVSLTMAFCMASPAFAADIGQMGTINITGSVTQLANQTIEVIPLLDVSGTTEDGDGLIVNGDGLLYDLNLAWLPFILETLLVGSDGSIADLDLNVPGLLDAEIDLLGDKLLGLNLDALGIDLVDLDLGLTDGQLLQLGLFLPNLLTLLNDDTAVGGDTISSIVSGLSINSLLTELGIDTSEGGLIGGVFDLIGGLLGGIVNLAVNLLDDTLETLLGAVVDVEGVVNVLLRGLVGLDTGLALLDLDGITNDDILTDLIGGLGLVSQGLGEHLIHMLNITPEALEAEAGLGLTHSHDLSAFLNSLLAWLDLSINVGIKDMIMADGMRIEMPAASVIEAATAATHGLETPESDATYMMNATSLLPLATVTFPDLPAGVYVIRFSGSSDERVALDPIMVTVPSAEAGNINLKAGMPSLTKQVAKAEEGVTDPLALTYKDAISETLDETFTYKIEAFIPDWEAYGRYDYRITDTLPEGVIYLDDNSLSVAMYTDADKTTTTTLTHQTAALTQDGGGSLTGPGPGSATDISVLPVPLYGGVDNYYVSEKPLATGGGTLEIEFGNLKSNDAFTGAVKFPLLNSDDDIIQGANGEDVYGVTLVITYTAKLDADAIVGGGFGNQNSAMAYYTNDPTAGGYGGNTLPVQASVYTFQIDVDKYLTTDRTKKLNGAMFVLSQTEDAVFTYDGTLSAVDDSGTALIAEDEAIGIVKDADSASHYRVATIDGDLPVYFASTAGGTVGTAPLGELVIYGLDVGTYYLHEVQGPFTYNADTTAQQTSGDRYGILPTPLEITIEPGAAGLGNHIIYSVGAKGTTLKEQGNSNTIAVPNGNGMPNTGGVGTVGLTILGVVVIAGGVIFASRKGRGKDTDQ